MPSQRYRQLGADASSEPEENYESRARLIDYGSNKHRKKLLLQDVSTGIRVKVADSSSEEKQKKRRRAGWFATLATSCWVWIALFVVFGVVVSASTWAITEFQPSPASQEPNIEETEPSPPPPAPDPPVQPQNAPVGVPVYLLSFEQTFDQTVSAGQFDVSAYVDALASLFAVSEGRINATVVSQNPLVVDVVVDFEVNSTDVDAGALIVSEWEQNSTLATEVRQEPRAGSARNKQPPES